MPRLSLLLAAAVIAIPGTALAQTQPVVAPLPADATLLEVTATGKVSRTPDIATIRAGVVTQGATAAAAVGENAARMAKVIAALKQAGVADRDLATAAVSLSPQYRYADNQPPVITGYQATNSVSVRFRDIARSGKILDALVAQGANQIDGPSLSLDQPEAALDEARTKAITAARARAELYARAAGLRVERIVSISENGENDGGSPRPPVMYRMAVAKVEAADTTVLAGETEVSATLAVRFALR